MDIRANCSGVRRTSPDRGSRSAPGFTSICFIVACGAIDQSSWSGAQGEQNEKSIRRHGGLSRGIALALHLHGLQNPERFIVQLAVADNHVRSVNASAPIPIAVA